MRMGGTFFIFPLVHLLGPALAPLGSMCPLRIVLQQIFDCPIIIRPMPVDRVSELGHKGNVRFAPLILQNAQPTHSKKNSEEEKRQCEEKKQPATMLSPRGNPYKISQCSSPTGITANWDFSLSWLQFLALEEQ